jgi:type I restriction enzyme, S subunit
VKIKLIPSGWIEKEGRRLDCGPYLSGAIEAKLLLEKLPVTTHLHELTQNGKEGIFHAGRESRTWVEDLAHGVPFMSGSDMMLADLSRLSLISKRRVAAVPKFIVRRNWTLITRSGTIGRMVYSRPDMDGYACSEDVLRVVPDQAKILPGYLYAFLASRYGLPLVVGGTYGAIIQHIEPEHISDLPVPRLGEDIERRVHGLVEEAAALRVKAAEGLQSAHFCVRQVLGNAPKAQAQARLKQVISSRDLASSSRFDAFFHNPDARLIESWLETLPIPWTTLGEIADVYDVPQFKHIYVDEAYGLPFYTSGDLFDLDRKPEKYLSRTRTKDLHKYVLDEGWVLLARSGQLGGIIGKPQFADSFLKNATTSDHVIRLVPRESSFAGYLFAFLDLPEVGYHLLIRTASGTSIPALWPTYLKTIRIPLMPDRTRLELDRQVRQCFEDRVLASEKERMARLLVEESIRDLGDQQNG